MIPSALLATYHNQPPTVTSVSPSTGTTAGGTAMTLTGTGLLTTRALSFGGNVVSTFTVVSDTSITFTSPAHAAGTGIQATVTTDGGGATGGSFAYSAPVVPATTTDDTAGSRTFTVLAYNTLTVEIWGGGGSGAAVQVSVGGVSGSNGTASSCSTLGMTANPGLGATGQTTKLGGTATGGNTTNTTGNSGLGSFQSSTGGGAGNGGGNVLISGAGTTNPGTTGTIPGGGGTSNNDAGNTNGGGSGGGYSKSVYTFGVTSGAPAVGAVLSYTVGSGGAAATLGGRVSGAGRVGRVKFTVA